MGIPVLILGESGSGKSASLRNLPPDKVGIFNVASKPLPFRTKFPMTVNTSDYKTIMASLAKNGLNAYVVDDAQYLMTFELFSKLNETGYAKFTQSAKNFYDLIQTVIHSTSDDTIVYFLQHTERADDGHIKAKTSGKMLDSQLTVEGLFSIVLMATTDGRNHQFITQSDGYTTCKSPMEMFPLEMENDLNAVDTAIREYYSLPKIGVHKSQKEKKAEAPAVTEGAKVP